MNADEGGGGNPIGQGDPWRQINIHIAGAGHHHVHAARPQQSGHLHGHIQHHIGFTQTADADGAGIGSAMAGVDHDPVAPSSDAGQPGRIHRCAARRETCRRSPSRGTSAQIALADVIQPPGRQAGEGQLPAVRSRAAQLQLIRIKADPGL